MLVQKTIQETDPTAVWSDPRLENKGGKARQTESVADPLTPMSVSQSFSLLFIMVLIAIGVTSAW